MSKQIKILKSFFVILSLAMIIQSCDGSETYYEKPDYFPLNDQSQWEYQWESRCDCPEKYLPRSTTTLLITGDTVLNGKKYSKIEYEYSHNEYGLLKIVRRENDRYFRANLSDGTEHVFLDTNIPVNHSWIAMEDDFYISKLFMRKPFKRMTVNSVIYHNVLMVEENISFKDHDFFVSSFHYYAKGVGEILTYYPRTRNSYQNGSKFSLLKSF